MDISLALKERIEKALDHCSSEQLSKIWEYIKQLEQETLPPLYSIHEQAIDTGITDLAEHHDRYLYGAGS